MYLIRLAKFLVFIFIISTGCTNSDNNEIEALKRKTASLQKQVDSLKALQSTTDSVVIDTPETPQPKTETTRSNSDGKLRPGKHDLTLQWISWDEPGSVNIQPAEGGWYSIEGSQKNRRNKDFISIKGLIKQISATDLEFKGEIISVVETVNGGKPCVRTGNKIFKTTKNRKYWRLQDMINCEGGMLTDYVDIYF
ncbi:MAG: hypothetical protein H7Y13_12545 [Sphingobacteriaceae bacterium]|nr:hypothetical protein [Sphingobacteriaceae bacterium]